MKLEEEAWNQFYLKNLTTISEGELLQNYKNSQHCSGIGNQLFLCHWYITFVKEFIYGEVGILGEKIWKLGLCPDND